MLTLNLQLSTLSSTATCLKCLWNFFCRALLEPGVCISWGVSDIFVLSGAPADPSESVGPLATEWACVMAGVLVLSCLMACLQPNRKKEVSFRTNMNFRKESLLRNGKGQMSSNRRKWRKRSHLVASVPPQRHLQVPPEPAPLAVAQMTEQRTSLHTETRLTTELNKPNNCTNKYVLIIHGLINKPNTHAFYNWKTTARHAKVRQRCQCQSWPTRTLSYLLYLRL